MTTNLISCPIQADHASMVFEISSHRLRIRVDEGATGETYTVELGTLSEEQLRDLADVGRRIVDNVESRFCPAEGKHAQP